MQQKSSVSVKAILILVLAGGGCLLVLAGILAAIFLPLRLNAGLMEGAEIAQNDPLVIERFGSPLRVGFLVMGKTQQFLYGDGVGNLSTSISGSNGRGEINFYIRKPKDGDWWVDSMSIYVNKGELIMTWDADERDLGFQLYDAPPSSEEQPTQALPPTPVLVPTEP